MANLLSSAVSSAGAATGAAIGAKMAQIAAQNGDGSSVSARAASSASQMYDRLVANAESNTARSDQMAKDLRDWQESMSNQAMEFNSAEAAKNREWQERMSNTAHQREVADLLAAGLNPVLSATGGNGASVTSGATASTSSSSGAKGDVDTSANSGMASVLGAMFSLMSSLASTGLNAANNMAIADKNNAMSKFLGELSSATQLKTTGMNNATTRYAADRGYASSIYNANMSYAGTKYASDNALKGTELQVEKTPIGAAESVLKSIFDVDSVGDLPHAVLAALGIVKPKPTSGGGSFTGSRRGGGFGGK